MLDYPVIFHEIWHFVSQILPFTFVCRVQFCPAYFVLANANRSEGRVQASQKSASKINVNI